MKRDLPIALLRAERDRLLTINRGLTGALKSRDSEIAKLKKNLSLAIRLLEFQYPEAARKTRNILTKDPS